MIPSLKCYYIMNTAAQNDLLAQKEKINYCPRNSPSLLVKYNELKGYESGSRGTFMECQGSTMRL